MLYNIFWLNNIFMLLSVYLFAELKLVYYLCRIKNWDKK